MSRTDDPWPNPGDLLHAILEGWLVAEISDVTLARAQSEPFDESRRGRGIRSVRGGRVAVAERFRTSR
jgi:hypothetical protein